jgi:NAD(P)-dependent dehydrogenase (short-subunit alcohol dehydrogenase family)
MAGKLDGKVAVITGAGGVRGIGRSLAIMMASEGAKVVVNDFGKASDGAWLADKVVAEIEQAKGVAVANYDSVATMAGGESIVKTAIDNFGKIDILVNTAGNSFRKKFSEMTEAEWDSIVSVNVKGTFACTKAAVPYMVQQKSGRIINFASRAGFILSGNNAAYSTSKAGIIGFTYAISRELKESNITVNAIFPSAFTDLFPNVRGVLSDNMPVANGLDADHVVPIVVYLATDEAKDITARIFYASGGDICIYTTPFKMTEANCLLRKNGQWTLDEIAQTIPPLLGMNG